MRLWFLNPMKVLRSSSRKRHALSEKLRFRVALLIVLGACVPAAWAEVPADGILGQLHLPLEMPVSFQASLFSGAVDVTCRVRPEAGYPWNITAEIRSFPMEQLAVLLPEPARSLRGGLVSGRLVLNGFLDPAYGERSTVRIEGYLSSDSLGWFQRGDLGRVQHWVLAGAEVRLRMAVGGSRANPVFSGSLQGESGSIVYLGREIPVSLLQVSFMESTVFDPVIDLSARMSVVSNAGAEYRVRFDVVGPSSRARPDLSSSPTLSRPDLESLLALGVPLSAFSEDEEVYQTGSYWAQQVFMLRALEVAAERIVGLAEDRAKRLLGLDEIRISTGVGTSDMEIAKRLGRRATLSYTSPVWHSNSYRVRLELKVNEYLFIESENDQTGDAGIDLRFKKKLR